MTMQQRIEQQLAALAPQHLQVLNESHMHSRGQETHYKAVIVSEQFAGLNSVKRHQKVYATMGELMGEIHAPPSTPTPPKSGPRSALHRPRRCAPAASTETFLLFW